MSEGKYNIVRGRPLRIADTPCCSQTPSPTTTRRASSTKPRRQSFSSSVREDDSGCAQSFVVSPLDEARNNEEALQDDDTASLDMACTMTMQQPTLCCPCGHFNGWKHIRLRGKGMSKSSSDLQLMARNALQRDGTLQALEPMAQRKVDPPPFPSGQSPLERLPNEIIDEIMTLLEASSPSDGAIMRKNDLTSCMLTSRTLFVGAVSRLYTNVQIPRSVVFSKFREQLARYPGLHPRVRRLDFSHFSSVGLGRTRRMNSEIQMVTSDTLLKCLDHTPQLREFLAQAHLDDDLDEHVIAKIFYGLSQLDAIDLCAASSAPFKSAFAAVISPENPCLPAKLQVKRLSLHECSTISSSTLAHLFPRLISLTHLDVSHTQVTDDILQSIPSTARLTHLNLSGCTHLSGEGVVRFLTTHPAVKDSLIYLNLLSDVFRYSLLCEADVDTLLPALPSSLQSLNLSGAKITSRHLPLLLPLTKHLEELSLGYAALTIDDLISIFVPKAHESDTSEDVDMDREPWVPSTLHYLDVTGVPGVTASRLLSGSCALLWRLTAPLEVLEIGEKILAGLQQRNRLRRKVGWTVKEAGRRAWYVREPRADAQPGENDSGRRSWKMGAMWWGMRKIPVADSTVGGLYGHYMFKYKAVN
ncbi:MAG: hypothetical protein M4579_001000 [Chaenotheca gracillima]|nr:MAG: hypothetical protein M4579_001000 [Chaenotheca gracillima]